MSFSQSLQTSDFLVTLQLPLEPDLDKKQLVRAFELARPLVDAVQVSDNLYAEGHIAGLAVARVALDNGVEPILHLTSRDRNRIAVHSDILGAMALGVSSLVLRRGNKLPSSLRGRVRGVFDMRTVQQIELASRLQESPGGAPVCLGAYATLMRPDDDWRPGRVAEKLDAGARFLQTRPCLDASLVQDYAKRLVEHKLTHRASFLVSVPVFASAAEARRLLELFPEIAIGAEVVQALAAASDPVSLGVSLARDMIADLREVPGVAGVNIVGSVDSLVDVLAD